MNPLFPCFPVRLVHADDQPFAPLFDHILSIAVFCQTVEPSTTGLGVNDLHDHLSGQGVMNFRFHGSAAKTDTGCDHGRVDVHKRIARFNIRKGCPEEQGSRSRLIDNGIIALPQFGEKLLVKIIGQFPLFSLVDSALLAFLRQSNLNRIEDKFVIILQGVFRIHVGHSPFRILKGTGG